MSSHDSCIQLLIDQAKAEPQQSLWLADDNVSARELPLIAQCADRIMTNRYHLFLAAESCKDACISYSDFDFDNLQGPAPAHIYYRVSKEKLLTHYLINQSFLLLPVGGELHLSGFKNDGIKTYMDKARKLFGEQAALINGPKSAKYARLIKRNENTPVSSQLLDDKDYQRPRTIFALQGKAVVSKPGVFGWSKQDDGSAFLISRLGELLDTCQKPVQQILDLGCGYGYISLEAFYRYPDLQQAEFVLADNNAAAVQCARTNLKNHNILGSAIDSDRANSANQRFDLILCNPPFHQGFDISQDITRLFLKSTSQHLKPEGKALFVVNQFVGIEKKAGDFFVGIKELARNKSFKLIVLDKPKLR